MVHLCDFLLQKNIFISIGEQMEALEKESRINLRLSEYDAKVLNQIKGKHPHLTSESDLLRVAIRCWDIEANDTNSKSNRLSRIEDRLSSLEEKVELLIKLMTKQ